MLRPSLLAAAVLALVSADLVIGAAGCTRRNEDFCCTTVAACERHGGDGELVRCPADSDRPYCDNEHRTCIEPPGTPCGPEGECADPDTPICFDGLCVECGGAADCPFSDPVCGEADHQCESCSEASDCGAFADRPFCQGGACVGCRNGDDCQAASAPICDEVDGTCRGCTSGAECGSDVCDWVSGGCVDEQDVLYVATDGSGDMCTRDDPCDSVMQAVGLASGGQTWILMAEGSYVETVSIDGKTIRIVGDGADIRPSTIDSAAFDVRGGADLRISGLHIHDADGNGDGPGDGVYCTNTGGASTLLLDRVLIDGNDDQGVDANNCDITVSRSTLSDNRRGGISLDSVDFDITNNFITANGSASVSAGVLIDKNPPARGRLEHNTITANINPAGSPSGIRCVLVGNPIQFRNNIVFGNQGSATQVDGDNCEHSYSVIGPNGVSGDGNIATAPDFVSETDFHLVAGSSGIDAAEESDIAIDVDGQPRPGGDKNDIGADELP